MRFMKKTVFFVFFLLFVRFRPLLFFLFLFLELFIVRCSLSVSHDLSI